MTKARKAVSRAAATRKARTSTQHFKLSPLGRKLLAAIQEEQALSWIGPEAGCLSEEIAHNAHYQRAWHRAHDRALEARRRLTIEVMRAPISLSNLADRALIQHGCPEHDVMDYLPAAKPTDACDPYMAVVAAVLVQSDIPLRLPHHDYDGTNGPPDAEARVRALLGNRQPKRRALSAAEREAVAKAAIADAEARAVRDPRPAPYFSEAR
jgi:hypothetical protein